MIKFGQKIKTENSDIKYWITSDLHFFHKGVLTFCPETRKWSDVEEMNKGLIEHWNSVVGVNDVVFHLGDFSFKGKEATVEILEQLNGNIVFILGNHDNVFRNQLRNDKYTMYDYLEVRYNGTKVCMMHFPITCWNSQGRGSVMFHGHSHSSHKGLGRTIDVGWDAQGRILSVDEAVRMCLDKEIVCPDHHKIIKE